MSALAEALLAAQRQAVAVLGKQFVAGTMNVEELGNNLDAIGLRDDVDQGLLIGSLMVVKQYGGEAPKPAGQTERKAPDQPTQAQMTYIAQLLKDRNLPHPDIIVSKEQASEIIEALKAGTYNADAYTVPF